MKVHCMALQLAGVLGVVLAAQASAQTTVPVTLQLPSFSVFTVDTTVVVPDSGRGYLGRVNRISQGRTSARVPFGNKLMPGLRNHATGGATAHAGMHATATILDRTELDPFTREAAFAINSAARDENDRAGLAIDYLRARDAARTHARRYGNSSPIDLRWELSQAAPLATTPSSAPTAVAVPSERTVTEGGSSRLESRSRGLLHFERRRGLGRTDSPSLLSRDRDALRLRERATAPGNVHGLRNRPASDAAPPIGPNHRVFPAPADETTRSAPSHDRSREPSGGSGR